MWEVYDARDRAGIYFVQWDSKHDDRIAVHDCGDRLYATRVYETGDYTFSDAIRPDPTHESQLRAAIDHYKIRHLV